MKKQDKVKELFAQLEEGVAGVYTSEQYRDYLTFVSKFHNYSARNCFLIYKQMPNASYVAGYNTWKNKHDRQVKAGEKGLSILGGSKRQRTDVEINPTTGKEEEQTRSYMYYFPCTVFDVSQTEGEELPTLCKELDGEVENFADLFACFSGLSSFAVEYEAIESGAKGYCSYKDERIAINEGMSNMQMLKTLIHEQVHARLHRLDGEINTRKREVEAESVAFIVCTFFGFDTQDYSFPYVASWASGREAKELLESQDTIQKEAHKIIETITEGLAKKNAA